MGSSFTKAIAPSAPAFTSPLVRDMARPGFPPPAACLFGGVDGRSLVGVCVLAQVDTRAGVWKVSRAPVRVCVPGLF